MNYQNNNKNPFSQIKVLALLNKKIPIHKRFFTNLFFFIHPPCKKNSLFV